MSLAACKTIYNTIKTIDNYALIVLFIILKLMLTNVF